MLYEVITVAAVRERALERFLTSTQTALRDLQPVPDYWPGGPYLVLPSTHPDLVGVFQSYLTTVRRVRAADNERVCVDAARRMTEFSDARAEALRATLDLERSYNFV